MRPARAPLVVLALTLAATPACESGSSSSNQEEPPPAATPGVASAVARTFLEHVANRRWDQAVALYDDTMAKAMPSGTLASTWKGQLREVGDFVGIKSTREAVEQGYQVVYAQLEFTAGTAEIKVVVDPQRRVSGLWFVSATPLTGTLGGGDIPAVPPDTDLPAGLKGRTVTVGAEGWPLPGAVVIPEGEGPFPAVVLVHGSGPHDRDETIGPNTPFKELAYGLAQRGVVVLRYAKRTKVHANRLAARLDFTVKDETIDDALAAVAALRQLPEVDGDKIFVVGHSLGGYLLPRVAAGDDKIRGFISLAGSARPIWEVLPEQLDYLSTLPEGAPPEAMKKQVAEDVEKIRALDLKNVDNKQMLLGVPAPYWANLKGYKPAALAAADKRPWLFLQGLRDYQVTTKDLEVWQAAMKGRKDVMFRSYPDLNHVFHPGQGTATPSEYMQKGSMPPMVFDDIASFIKRNSR